MTVLLLLAALASAIPAPQGPSDDFKSEVGELKDAVISPATPEPQLYERAKDIFEKMPETKVSVKVQWRGWDRGPAPKGEEADVEKLMTAAREKLSDLNVNVPSDLSGAMGMAGDLQSKGKMSMDGGLKAEVMGRYEYLRHNAELGAVKLNKALGKIAAKVGELIAFATVAHEAGHARDHQQGKLSPDAVIKGEILAFKTQYHWLKVVDPHGEKVAWLRTVVADQEKSSPSGMGKTTLAYLEHLAKLHDTNGEESKIEGLVKELGYEEHDHDEDDGHKHPVRS